MRAIDVVRKLAPSARPAYLAAFESGEALLRAHGVDSDKRLAHFLAQVLHESGALRLERENMNYRAERLLEVFGAGHSAKVTEAEALQLAGRPEAIAERVYGLGNPVKAAELGNTTAGDGFRYRGGGLMQTTGRGAYAAIGAKCGVPFEDDPDLVASAEHALKPALFEWTEKKLNAFADSDDILSISRAINFGNASINRTPNGFAERKVWLQKAKAAFGGQSLDLAAAGADAAVSPVGPSESVDRSMNLREIQRRLKEMAVYLEDIDGDYGPATAAAIRALLMNQRVTVGEDWKEVRLVIAAGQSLCRMGGIEVGAIDGLLGPQTREAFEIYRVRQENGGAAAAALETWRDDDAPDAPMPEQASEPGPVSALAAPQWPREADVAAFFGAPGTNQTTLILPFKMKIAWDLTQTVTKVSCNVKIRDSLERIWTRTLDHYGIDEIQRLQLDLFGGCLNVRKKRGGSGWSMHAYGIAWDVDPSRNTLHMSRDEATLDGADYDAFWSFVEAEGAVSLGRTRDFDWMHFQFARL